MRGTFSLLALVLLAAACGSESQPDVSSTPPEGGSAGATSSAGDDPASTLRDRVLRFGETADERRAARSAEKGKRVFRRERAVDAQESARREAEYQAEQLRAVERLASESPSERITALAVIDMEGPGQSHVLELVRSETDPNVRAAAVSRLATDHSAAGHAALLEALEDPQTQVLRKALAALEVVGDESDASRLVPLIETHPDPEIREQAAQVKHFLQ